MITHPFRVPAAPTPCTGAGPPLDVVDWRCCRLREAGFTPRLAGELASQPDDVDQQHPPEAS
jgi:hypothetical protein